MYVYEIDLLTTFKLFENFLLLLYGFWPYSQRRAIVVFMYNLFETFSFFFDVVKNDVPEERRQNATLGCTR